MSSGRIYVIPTWRGFIVITTSVVVVLIGAIHASSVVFLYAFMILTYAFLSLIITHNQFRKVEVSELSTIGLYAGSQAHVSVRVSTPSELIISGQLNKFGWQTKSLSSTGTLDLPVSGLKRGRFLPDRVAIGTSSPARLFYAWKIFRPQQPLTVYPAPIDHAAPLTKTKGSLVSHQRQNSDELSDLRKKTESDSWKRVNWPLYAKSQKALLNEFEQDNSPTYLLDIHQLNSLSVEQRLEQICHWALLLEKNNSRYAVSLVANDRPSFSRGHHHLHDCLTALAHYAPQDLRHA